MGNWLIILLALALSAGCTWAVRKAARHYRIVAAPKADRWHTTPTALLGGVAIAFTVLSVAACCVPFSWRLLAVCVASGCLFSVGLIDDFLNIKPYQKLVGQIIGAVIVIACGLILPWTASVPLNMVLTIFWLIGITNAINLLDNMDGLAAGVAAIASVFLSFHFSSLGQADVALLFGVFAASLVGFLFFNSYPATIFMGDCGSMFVGFFLASAALMTASENIGGRSRTFLPVLAVPVLTLLIPIFDTTLVTLARKAAGRAASQGGRDHASHRLVALGLSERRAVWLLYSLAIIAGLVALLVRDLELDEAIAIVVGLTVLLTITGVYLAGVKVYDDAGRIDKSRNVADANVLELDTAQFEVADFDAKATGEAQSFASFLIDLSYKRRVFEVVLDVVLISLAYYIAYTIFFGSLMNAEAHRLFVQTLPILILVKLMCLLVCGVYRGFWRYVGIADLITMVKAVLAGSIVSILIFVFAFRFEGLSRTIFALDGALLLLFVAGSRGAFRALRQVLPHTKIDGARVLIYGADDAGETLLREARSNQSLHLAPVAFIDADSGKHGKRLHGLRVYDCNGNLRGLCREQAITQIIIATRHISKHDMEQLTRVCREADIRLKQMRIEFDEVS